MKTFYKTLLLLFLSSLFLIFNSFGQGENNIWYFGYHAGLDFSSGSPVAIPNGQIYQWEGVATISDTAGNLLFYTDGFSVWNQNHIVMPNGTGLGGNNSSTQSATIVPMPGNATQYYIFTCPEGGNSLGYFRYSLVDMTLAGGMGDVTLKNVALNVNSSEKCVTVYKGASTDVWVITHDNDTAFYAYLVTSSGISPPVQSFYSSVNSSYFAGYMKASPQGDRIADAKCCAFMGGFALYDFDCTTGIVSNEINISIGGIAYGIEFSPDGTKLYAFPWGAPVPVPIYQYDVTLNTAAAITASQIIVGYANQTYVGGAQIGPDQKIYLSIDFADSLPVINNPNVQGTGCNFVDNAIYLNGNFSRIGLPALIRGSVCYTTGVTEMQKDLNEFQIFPNPSSGIFQINFSKVQNFGKVSYEVINTLGQTVFATQPETKNQKPETTLNLSFLPKGIYVLKINNSVSALSNKFVIE